MCSNQCFQLSFGGTGRPGGPYDANDYSLAVFADDSKYRYGRMSLILADLGLSVGVRDQFAPPPSPSLGQFRTGLDSVTLKLRKLQQSAFALPFICETT